MPNEAGDISALLQRCAELKRQLVTFANNHFRDAIQSELATMNHAGESLSEWDVSAAIDNVVHNFQDLDGSSVVGDFIKATPALSDEDRAIILRWRESYFGVFEVRGRSGAYVDTVNLVDDLSYRLVATTTDPQVLAKLARPGFIFTRIVPLRDFWMMSGLQSLLRPSDRTVALGMAANLASSVPHLRFRNPVHVEEGRRLDRVRHERFVEHFGVPWFAGSPEEVERLHDVPGHMREAERIAMFSDPVGGLTVFPGGAELLRALDDPSCLDDEATRAAVLRCFDMQDQSPYVVRQVAAYRREALDVLMRALLGRPGFCWANDGEAYTRELNPRFFETEPMPLSVPFPDEMKDALEAWERRNREVVKKRPHAPNRKDKRKQARAARRKNRR